MAPPTSVKPGRRKGGRPVLTTLPGAQCRQLTPREVMHERLALAHDLLTLVAADEELPALMQARVRSITEGLRSVWVELRQ